MLTPDDCALGHRLAAEWLERAGERDARTLAEHFERGGEPARAIDAYLRAATDALHGNDFAATISHGERAIACGAQGETLGRVRLLQAEAERWRGQSDVAAKHAGDAYKRITAYTPLWYEVAGELAVESTTTGDVATLRTIATALLADRSAPTVARLSALLRSAVSLHRFRDRELVDRLCATAVEENARLEVSHPVVFARLARMRAIDAMGAGNPQEFVELTQESRDRFREIGDTRNVCFMSGEIGYGLLELGLYEQAETALRETIAEAERLGIRNTLIVAKHNLGLVLARVGNLAEAERVEREALELVTDTGDPRMFGGCEAYLSVILLAAGRADEAEVEARHGAEALDVHRTCLPAALAPRIDALLALGRTDEAVAIAVEGAKEFTLGSNSIDAGEAHFAVAIAEALARAGRMDEAREAIRGAHDRLLARATRIRNAVWRDAFLFRVPEHARTLARYDDWVADAG
jgi:tetratricopeptide (TPR) repeat protein